MTDLEAALRILGLGHRAGALTIGVEGTRATIRRGKARMVVLARDASPRARGKVVGVASSAAVPVMVGPDASTLGHRLGRPPVHALAVTDRGISQGLMACDVSLMGMTTEE